MTYYEFISRFDSIDFEGNKNVRIAFDNILEEDNINGYIRSYIESWSFNCMSLNEANEMYEEYVFRCIDNRKRVDKKFSSTYIK